MIIALFVCQPTVVISSNILVSQLQLNPPKNLRIGTSTGDNSGSSPSGLLNPDDFVYQGAFRLPKGDLGGSRFGYGGHQMAFNLQGDPKGYADGYPGSLYISGHVYDQLVAEVSIPAPVISQTKNAAELPVATLIQPFADPTGGLRATGENASSMRLGGINLLDAGNGLKLYWTVYMWYNVSNFLYPSHGYSNPTLGSTPNAKGLWYLANYDPQKTAGYIFDVPLNFASEYFGGKRLISGLQVSQGLATSSNGPAMFAYAPWQHPVQPPEHGIRLDTIPLVYFPHDNPAPDFKACDAWRGGSWPASGDNQAVLIVGRKSLGEVYYGEGRPGDCSQAKGYHCTPYEPQILFYDPAHLAAVARGEMKPWQVVPYRTWSPQAYLWPTCDGYLNGVSFDRQNQILYLLQYGADRVTDQYEPYPLVHVFRVIK